jgi:hypothetical protein
MDKFYEQQLVQTPINLDEEPEQEVEPETVNEVENTFVDNIEDVVEGKLSFLGLIRKYSKQLDLLINIVLVLLLIVLVLQLVNDKKCVSFKKLTKLLKVKK